MANLGVVRTHLGDLGDAVDRGSGGVACAPGPREDPIGDVVRAVIVSGYGGAPTVGEWRASTPREGEALLHFVAAGLNPVDVAIGAGRFYLPLPTPPYVAGAEAVATVISSARFARGTRVWSLSTTGRFAERFVARDADLVPVPDGVSSSLAAAVGIAGLAGWMPITTRGALLPGERVLVLGASGVVGQVAVQAARAAGASWIVAAGRSVAGRERALRRGADVAVGVGDGDFGARLADAAGDGIDLVVDTLWGEPLVASVAVLRAGARIVHVGTASGPTAALAGGPLRGKRIDIRGFAVFSEAHDDRVREYAAVCQAAADGTVAVDIDEVPLADAPDAWATLATHSSGRKLVLVP
jgi:NADPH2:quinone reductase